MTTLFISDLHLSDKDPHTLSLFEHFISHQASQAEQLFILGDLFEAWVGDDDTSDTAKRVAESLSALGKQGTQIYFIHGNRDFLLGESYASRCGMRLLADPTVMEIAGKKWILSHGDLLCTDDKPYQKMRKIFHTPWIQRLFLALPRKIREKIGQLMRGRSRPTSPSPSQDVNPDEVALWFQENACHGMIHGHTHQPAHHQIGQNHRYVLGAWDIKPMILIIAGTQIILKSLDS